MRPPGAWAGRFASALSLIHICAVGAEKNHFSCALSDGRNTVAGIMFHCTDIEALMHTDSVVNACLLYTSRCV